MQKNNSVNNRQNESQILVFIVTFVTPAYE